MKKIFRYAEPDKMSKWLTAGYLLAFAVGIALIWAAFGWSLYTKVLISAILAAVLLLYTLSIPRKMELTDDFIYISCVLELTRIPIEDIRGVRLLEKTEMKYEIPLLGSFGLFGYFGYYLNLRTFRISTLYCTTWSDFIEITDSSEKRYVVSCLYSDIFVQAVRKVLKG